MKLMPLLSALFKKVSAGLSQSETRCVHLLMQRLTPDVLDIFEESETLREFFFTSLSLSEGHHKDYMSFQRLALQQVRDLNSMDLTVDPDRFSSSERNSNLVRFNFSDWTFIVLLPSLLLKPTCGILCIFHCALSMNSRCLNRN